MTIPAARQNGRAMLRVTRSPLAQPPAQAPQDPAKKLTRTERTAANKNFTAGGRLEITLTRGWEKQPILSQRDAGRVTLEDQLPTLVRARRAAFSGRCSYTAWMSAMREELHQLVDELPERRSGRFLS